MKVRDEYYVVLKNKRYPMYAGVLIAATESGLRSLTTELVQIPTDENGQVAIVQARAEFEDGRVFSDLGDCSPRNTSPQIATASIRMASTRAKGRVLRDAIGLGETLREELLEELPDLNGEDATDAPVERPRNGTERVQGNGEASFCESCGLALTASQAVYSRNKFSGALLCPAHQKMAAG